MKPQLILLLLWSAQTSASAQVESIWLTHRSGNPDKLVVNWETKQPGESLVRFGLTTNLNQTMTSADVVTLHHVEIPTPARDTRYFYQVQSRNQVSEIYSFRSYPISRLRVAIVADWQDTSVSLEALRRDEPHILLTAGDNVPNVYGTGSERLKHYRTLIDSQAELFRSTPFMPVLGNHDKESRPRGDTPPEEAVYDVEATAFREFFDLPDDEWKWVFDIPEFDLRFVALDLNHISDLGTTWQASHDYRRGSPQFEWYDQVMKQAKGKFVVTLQNERNANMRSREDGAWGRMFERGTIVVSGFGYYGERAVANGMDYYNVCLGRPGAVYRDPQAVVLESTRCYLLLTVEKGSMTVELKRLDGLIIDKQVKRKAD